MGKAGRVACILTPMLLTIASFICLVLIELSGWNSNMLPSYYFFQADFTNLSVADAGALADSTTLTAALSLAQDQGLLHDRYQIHLWNYCTQDDNDGVSTSRQCTPRSGDFYFNPVEVWGLNATTAAASTATPTVAGNNAVQSKIAELQGNAEELENELLGESGEKALDAYRKVSRWMFIAYAVSFWTSLATIVLGILAIFSRWGSLLTWIAALVSRPLPVYIPHRLRTLD